MVSYTPISLLPYPVMSDPPNGPDQFQQLARALEPKLVNRFTSATARNLKITAPALGMLTFRDDDKVYEYWNGSVWAGIDQSVAVGSRSAISTAVDRVLTTTESPALAQVSVTLTNPSSLYRMLWFSHGEFNIQYSWTVAGLYMTTRHYMQHGAAATNVNRPWSDYSTAPGTTRNYSGAWPLRSGFLAAGASIVISMWVTVTKSNATAGTITMTGASCDLNVVGMTTL